MTFHIKCTDIYHCSLERAFKAPMLCDITKVHAGYGPMPRVTHCTDDGTWGRPNGHKKVHFARNFMLPGGATAIDRVLERTENRYWKIEITDFNPGFLGFEKFVGEWNTREVAANTILIEYAYTLHARAVWFYPFNWAFARLFWRRYMQRVLQNVKKMAETDEPYDYP
jgi:Polyketide cyclase / dehydrase and lipid transport